MNPSVIEHAPPATSVPETVENVYLPKVAVLDRVVNEIQEVKTFFWHFEDAAEQRAFRRFRPGQFAQVSLFGVGEFPTSLPPSPTEDETFFTVRQVGSCTSALHAAEAGRQIRGARALRQRLSDGGVSRQEPRLRCRGDWPDSFALRHRVRAREPRHTTSASRFSTAPRRRMN